MRNGHYVNPTCSLNCRRDSGFMREFDEKLLRSEQLEALPWEERTQSEHRELWDLNRWFAQLEKAA